MTVGLACELAREEKATVIASETQSQSERKGY